MNKKSIAAGVVKGLGEIAEETGKKAVSDSADIAAQALEQIGIGVRFEKNPPSPLKQKVEEKEQEELAQVRRDIEAEVEKVRQKKVKLEEQEEEFLKQIQEQRKEEEEELEKLQEPVIPAGKKPRGLAPWIVKGKQGTRETKVRAGE